MVNPLVAESNELLGRFDAGQLGIITEFVRRERGLLTRHRARAQELLTAAGRSAKSADRDAAR